MTQKADWQLFKDFLRLDPLRLRLTGNLRNTASTAINTTARTWMMLRLRTPMLV